MAHDVQNYGPVVWLLVMLLMFCMVIIALLLEPPDSTSQVDDAILDAERRLP